MCQNNHQTGGFALLVAGCLNRWAWNGSKRTENTAVTRLWFQNSMAVFTFIKNLTCVFGHDFRFLITTRWTGYDRFQSQLFHFSIFLDSPC